MLFAFLLPSCGYLSLSGKPHENVTSAAAGLEQPTLGFTVTRSSLVVPQFRPTDTMFRSTLMLLLLFDS